MALIDSGSCINTVGDKALLHDYTSPSSSPLTFRSATNEGVCPAGEGHLYLPMHDGAGPPVKVPTQHIPQIPSSILSPGWMLSALKYDQYSLICNRNTGISTLTFTKDGQRSITFQGRYENYLAYIDTSKHPIGTILNHPALQPQLEAPLQDTMAEAIAQMTELCSPILSLTPDDLHHQVHQSIMTITGEQVAY